jgi:MFS family permease
MSSRNKSSHNKSSRNKSSNDEFSSYELHHSTTSEAQVPLGKADVRRIFYGLMLSMFLSALNQTIVATALPTIGRDFGDFENLSWVIIAYLLSSTVVSPLYGKLSDIYGRRGMMLVAIGLFIAGSAVAAAAPDMSALIAGRTLQGIGGGGIVPLTQTTIADMVTPRERGHYQAYMGALGSWPALRAPRLAA